MPDLAEPESERRPRSDSHGREPREREEAAFSDGALPKKTKELIGVGISVKIDCESCMQWQAAAAGASMRGVLEAFEVGMEMGGGPATVSARFALEVLEGTFAGGRGTARHAAQQSPARRRKNTPYLSGGCQGRR